MFETDNFRQQLEAAITGEAAASGMEQYQPRITSYLQNMATENEPQLMEREFRKAAAQRRGIADALESARGLTRLASRYALAEGRTTLEVGDVEKAFRDRFCQVWPFCRS